MRGVKSKLVCTPQFFILRTNSNLISPEYLAWVLNHSSTKGYFAKTTEGVSSTVRNIKRSVLEQVPLNIPSLEIQKKILDITALHKKEELLHKKLMKVRTKEVTCAVNELLNKGNN